MGASESVADGDTDVNDVLMAGQDTTVIPPGRQPDETVPDAGTRAQTKTGIRIYIVSMAAAVERVITGYEPILVHQWSAKYITVVTDSDTEAWRDEQPDFPVAKLVDIPQLQGSDRLGGVSAHREPAGRQAGETAVLRKDRPVGKTLDIEGTGQPPGKGVPVAPRPQTEINEIKFADFFVTPNSGASKLSFSVF